MNTPALEGRVQKRKKGVVGASLLFLAILALGLGFFFGLDVVKAPTKTVNKAPQIDFSLSDVASLAAALFAERSTPAVVVEPAVLPPLRVSEGDLPTTSAHAFLVRDVSSGAFLLNGDAYTPFAIASITKLMSALVLLDTKIDWEATAIVPADEVSDSHVLSGEVQTKAWLWQAGLVGSSNKAILALVDSSGLTREAFVVRMNEKARVLGMSRAVFTDPTGLEVGNQASVADVSTLLDAAMKQGEIRSALMTPSYDIVRGGKKVSTVWSTNWLMLGWVPHTFASVIGGKTGYIPESGYNVSLRIKNEDDREIDVVVLGSSSTESRFTDAKSLAEWVFAHYEWKE